MVARLGELDDEPEPFCEAPLLLPLRLEAAERRRRCRPRVWQWLGLHGSTGCEGGAQL